jgi:orotidine-5'-phosphate decarboxylase
MDGERHKSSLQPRATSLERSACGERLIVALDFTALAHALRVARQLQGLIRTVKVGSALFTACGPAVIRRLRSLGFEVMLDLKFFDIPSTVELSCQAATRHRVSLVTVHAAGERAMLEAAVRGVRVEAHRMHVPRPGVLAVIVLTSVVADVSAQFRERVMSLAHEALQAGCDGVVASAQEAAALRRRFGERLRIVCPGIRRSRVQRDDQRRVCTPAEALACGADALVVGRPITAARRPRAAAQQMLNDMEVANGC